MDSLFVELTNLVKTALELDCPILSGNMKDHIELENVNENNALISISGPSYDVHYWEKTGIIKYTGDYDYAVSVNGVGAFGGKSTKSKHWVNKSIVKTCQIIASKYGAKVIIDVEL